jgi:glutathione S-transferase
VFRRRRSALSGELNFAVFKRTIFMPAIILRTSPTTPFGRKVSLAIAVLGLEKSVEVRHADTNNPEDSLRQQNPLGKIPVLVLADGTAIFDSPVILEYLDRLAGGGRLIPSDPAARFPALTLAALADGILDAALLRRYETMMHEPGCASSKWDELQQGKVERGLAVLEKALPSASAIGIGEIGVACALGYLDFRFAGHWRASHPRLAAWFDAFAGRCPGFAETRPR